MSKDFQKMNPEDLQKTLTEKREKLLNIRFSLSGGKSKKSAEIQTLKREVAQILTLLTTTK
jgi:ribosomal protein L29